jgi:Ca2+-transporting ATPase
MLDRWHAETGEVILHLLGTHPARGLEPAESSRRLRERGPNAIRQPRPPALARLLARELADPLLLLLVAAAALCVHLGLLLEAAVAAAAAALNATLGFLLDYRPDRSLAALHRITAPGARVIRGGKPFLIPAAELVPGDLAELGTGDRVPADLRLLRAEQLFVDESALTGESLPVGKDPDLVLPEETPLADRANMLFAGSVVTGGRGVAVVTATGMRTEVGRIAKMLEEIEPGPTPLQRRLAGLGQALALAGLASCAVAALAHRLRHRPPAEALQAVASLALAAVPESLAAVVAGALVFGVRHLARKHVLVRTASSVEALGSLGVICTEKTGMLTRNEMTVRELIVEEAACAVTGDGYAPEGHVLRDGRPVQAASWESLAAALKVCVLCNGARLSRDAQGAWETAGDPTDVALLALAAKAGVWREDFAGGHQLLAAFPFSADRKRMTVVISERGGRAVALTKGAPAVVLSHCLHQRTAAGVRPLSPADRERILHQSEAMAGRALRVLGLACREDVRGEGSHQVERSMVWVGLVGMLDPPRPEVPAAIARCRDAGVGTVIITGDHRLVALAVAAELGAVRPGDEALGGDELDRLTPEALRVSVEHHRVYARVTAAHKLRIVRAWKQRGQLIAMTGDGVNDAPALKEADIGIARGTGGSEVTREAADLVLAADDFSAVATAVEEGRGICARIHALIGYLVSCSLAAVVALLVAAVAGLPPPLAPLQVLWLGLVSSALPALALGLEPLAPAAGHPAPPGHREPFLRRESTRVAFEGAVIAAAALAAFLVAWRPGAGAAVVERARTQAFAVLVLAQLVHAFGCRGRAGSVFSRSPLSNPALLGAVALAGLLLAALVQVPLLHGVFGTVALVRAEWIRAGALALASLAVIEAGKLWLRRTAEAEG